MRSRVHLGVAVAGTLLAGCFVFDDGHLRDLEGAGDAGAVGDAAPEDAGPPPDAGTDASTPPTVDDVCGSDAPSQIIRVSTQDIPIDTREMTNQVVSSCGGAQTSGNDGFLAIDVRAGEYWHFHLRADPAGATPTAREPALYMLFAPTGSCDARDCRFSSDVCEGNGEEHFGFVADSDGRWYLGVDDRAEGGGEYLLTAVRPVCGDGIRDHGEACDDENLLDGDGCSGACLRELTEEEPREIEPNDNPTEANALILIAGEFTVNGAIGGPGACRYADTFAIEVPTDTRMTVRALQTDLTPCDDPALTAGYELRLQTADFTDVVSGLTDANGCAAVDTGTLSGGVYFLSVTLPAELERPVPYRLRVTVAP